ncbi:hypothetical protein C0989_005458, partial [Termitomyces sp. Mn162]
IKEIASNGLMEGLMIAKESSDWNPILKVVLGGVVAVVSLQKLGCNKILQMQSHGGLRHGLQAISDADTLMDVDNEIMQTIGNFKVSVYLLS